MNNKKAPASTGTISEQSPISDIVARFERAYIERMKLALFPVKATDKVPMTQNGFKDAVSDWAEYERLHGGREHNIGLPTGEINGLFVLDIDPRHGGNETIQHVIHQYGSLPSTWVAKTQSGGRHYYFLWDRQRPVGNKANILPGIDVRGNGGYVLLPPSKVEGTYEWMVSPSQGTVASAPDWLYQLLETDKQQGTKDLSHLAAGVHDGSRNVSMTSLLGTLLGRGVDVKLVWALADAYNQVYVDPPLSDDELERIFTSIANRELAKRERRIRGRAS